MELERNDPLSGFEICLGIVGRGLKGGGALVGCVNRGISDTVSHISSAAWTFSNVYKGVEVD